MADVKVTESHALGAAEAIKRIASFEEMMAKYGVKSIWKGNSAKLDGTGVSGSIDVTDTAVSVVVKLGMLAKMAGIDPGKLEGPIRKRLKAAFES
ncbi:MAG: polyhydroxyalkanoic acid system family protein [Myxococcales bacterium]|nr:polyhydroxyalkanoic acid system family protein [Myxococcales bacterium]